jgi:hypothetical protein
MALNLLIPGYATLQYEIAEERASALGRPWTAARGRVDGTCRMPANTANTDRKIRDSSSTRRDMRSGSWSCKRGCVSQHAHELAGLHGAERGYAAEGPLARRASVAKNLGLRRASANVLNAPFRRRRRYFHALVVEIRQDVVFTISNSDSRNS